MSTAAIPESIEGVQIIGIDCAAQPGGFGLARARVRDTGLENLEIMMTGKGKKNCFDQLSAQIRCWVEGDNCADPPNRTLLALDAPLGWPIHLTRALHRHRAGAPLERPFQQDDEDPNPGNHLFRRHTDRFIAQKFPGALLDIGADRIARVARSGLEVLGGLGTTAGEHSPGALLWDPEHLERLGAIEVYPRLTLRHLRPSTGNDEFHYKGTKPAHACDRREIVKLLRATKTLNLNANPLPRKKTTDDDDYHHDAIDATLCVLEGLHFLLGHSVGPDHPAAFQWLDKKTEGPTAASIVDIKDREGWIWFHRDLLKGPS